VPAARLASPTGLAAPKMEPIARRDRLNAALDEWGGTADSRHERQKCFFAKALPEPDFKYFSNAIACAASLKAM
jgi:hypothetical protein